MKDWKPAVPTLSSGSRNWVKLLCSDETNIKLFHIKLTRCVWKWKKGNKGVAQEKHVKVLEWPSQVKEEWNKIPPGMCANLVSNYKKCDWQHRFYHQISGNSNKYLVFFCRGSFKNLFIIIFLNNNYRLIVSLSMGKSAGDNFLPSL